MIKIQKNVRLNNKVIKRNFIYKNIDFTILKTTLDKLKSYSKWLIIGFCLKDLYLGVIDKEQQKIYDLLDNFQNYLINITV